MITGKGGERLQLVRVGEGKVITGKGGEGDNW